LKTNELRNKYDPPAEIDGSFSTCFFDVPVIRADIVVTFFDEFSTTCVTKGELRSPASGLITIIYIVFSPLNHAINNIGLKQMKQKFLPEIGDISEGAAVEKSVVLKLSPLLLSS
jgi:hypothetical protein